MLAALPRDVFLLISSYAPLDVARSTLLSKTLYACYAKDEQLWRAAALGRMADFGPLLARIPALADVLPRRLPRLYNPTVVPGRAQILGLDPTRVVLIDLATGRTLRHVKRERPGNHGLSLCPDGSCFAVEQAEIVVYDTQTFTPRWSVRVSGDLIKHLASPDRLVVEQRSRAKHQAILLCCTPNAIQRIDVNDPYVHLHDACGRMCWVSVDGANALINLDDGSMRSFNANIQCFFLSESRFARVRAGIIEFIDTATLGVTHRLEVYDVPWVITGASTNGLVAVIRDKRLEFTDGDSVLFDIPYVPSRRYIAYAGQGWLFYWSNGYRYAQRSLAMLNE